jgi:hypothetical protein
VAAVLRLIDCIYRYEHIRFAVVYSTVVYNAVACPRVVERIAHHDGGEVETDGRRR